MERPKEIEQIAHRFEELEKRYTPKEDLLGGDALSKLRNEKKNFQEKAREMEKERRILRIGIIGRIKSGKSSFLNSFFFDSREILPKAATPMTAALTRLQWQETAEAEVEFYTPEEWQSIQQTAQKARQQLHEDELLTENELGEEEKACLELVDQVKKLKTERGLDPESVLGTTRKINAQTDKEIKEELQNYVGARGIYMPLVRSTSLGLTHPGLKDMEVVDTPGLNDPVVNRSQRTQDFLGMCDVVFLFSTTSYFLDKEDFGLLFQGLPEKGIDHIYIVGSRFDGAISDECDKYDDLISVVKELKRKYTHRAKELITETLNEELPRKASEKSPKHPMERTCRKLLEKRPIFISSMALDILRHKEKLSENENFYNENFTHWFDTPLSEQELEGISGFHTIQKAFEEVRQEKDRILLERNQNFLEGQRVFLTNQVKGWREKTAKRLQTLQESTLREKEKEQEAAQRELKNLEVAIKGVFDAQAIKLRKKISQLRHEIDDVADNISRVEIKTGEKTETEYYTVEKSGFWSGIARFFGEGGYERRSRSYTVTWNYAAVNDAVRSLESLAKNIREVLKRHISEAAESAAFRKAIVNVIKDTMDLEKVKPEVLLTSVNNALEAFNIPEIHFNSRDQVHQIRQSFSSSEVRDDEAVELAKKTDQAVKELLKKLGEDVDTWLQKAEKALKEEREKLMPEISQDLRKEMEELRKAFTNMEEGKKNLKELLAMLDKDLQIS